MTRSIKKFVVVTLCTVLFLSVATPALAAITNHRVQPGDTLWRLSYRYGTTVHAIQATSGYWSSTIYPGQVLRIPVGGNVYYSNNDVYLLAQLIRAEAEDQPYVGQVAVGAVVLNRVRSPHFPNTVAGVIFQPGQFEPVDNGRIFLQPTQTQIEAARAALQGWDPTGGAVYFFNPYKTSSGFLWSRPWKTTIGSHRFTA